MTTKKPLIIALGCGLLIAVLTWFYLNSMEEKYRQESKPIPVLTARGYIPRGTALKDRMIQISKVPKQYIQPGAFTSVNELINEKGESAYITLLPILENEQIINSKLANIKKEMGLSGTIPAGKNAVPLPANDVITLGGLINPGNHVNVLCTFDYEERGRTYSSTVMILQNVEVLTIGNKIAGTEGQFQDAKNANLENEPKESVITLALTPEEAALLTFARERGNITIALRAADDETTAYVPPVKIENIIRGAERIKSPKSDTSGAMNYLRQLQESLNK